jgi:hypothetical protein
LERAQTDLWGEEKIGGEEKRKKINLFGFFPPSRQKGLHHKQQARRNALVLLLFVIQFLPIFNGKESLFFC